MTESEGKKAGVTGRTVGRRSTVATIIILACLLGIVLAQWIGPWGDSIAAWIEIPVMNVASYVLGIVAILTLGVWWLRRPGISLSKRCLPLGIGFGGLAAFFILFQYEGVSGDMVPRFRYRFAQSPVAISERSSLPEKYQSDTTTQDVAAEDRVTEDFPGFLGAQRDAVVAVRAFDKNWSSKPPVERWRHSIGQGWSGFAIAQGCGFTLEQRGQQEWVTCYRLDDGSLRWRHVESGLHTNPLGGTGPRSTPTVYRNCVYAQTATGRLLCLDAKQGELLWKLDLLERGGIDQDTSEQRIPWGRAGSPLIIDGMAIVPFGGHTDQQDLQSPIGSLIALNAETGQEQWVGGTTQISYASPVAATLAGVRQVVSVNESNVTGHALNDGRVLWSSDWPGSSNAGANCASPIVLQDNGLLLGKGYGGGSRILRLKNDPDSHRQTVTVQWASTRVLKTKFTNACIAGDYAYGLSDGFLECVRLADGSRQWRQPRSSRYGHGQVLRIQDVLLVQSEKGPLAIVACDPEAYLELGRIEALSSKTWNNPAISGTTLLVRNDRERVAYDLPRRNSSDKN